MFDNATNSFLESQKYLTLLNTSGQILFYPGMPGAGKTMMAARVIDKVLTEMIDTTTLTTSLAYIYCDHQSKSKQSARELLGSLLQ